MTEFYLIISLIFAVVVIIILSVDNALTKAEMKDIKAQLRNELDKQYRQEQQRLANELRRIAVFKD